MSHSEYRDKVFACWLGKNIGGTLGSPYECRQYVNILEFYDPIPNGSAPNDDLDFQLVWLKMLEDKGIDITLPNFTDYWIKYLSAYPWNEYGSCFRNLGRGLHPPISGCFENYFVDGLGALIRSEIWACVATGDPQLAAEMAWMDSVVDHAGEGTYGEMFWAAVESAAFVLNDPETLIQIGLAMIPIGCVVSRLTRDALWCWKNGIKLAEARERIATIFGRQHNSCEVIPNQGFIILGWLYGKDFGDKLCKAVNCGYDTDCTGATLGALLGIIGGTAVIPKEWREPIREEIVLHKYTGKFNAPKTISELTNRTMNIAEKVIDVKSSTIKFSQKTSLPANILSLLFRNEKARTVLQQDIHSAVAIDGDLEITLHYGGEPVLRPGIHQTFEISFYRKKEPVEAEVEIDVPNGWQVSFVPDNTYGHKKFSMFAKNVPDRNTIIVTIKLPDRKRCVNFTIFGPGETKGFSAGASVPTCSKCGARVEGCICNV